MRPGGAGRTKGKAGELQPRGSLDRALADEVERNLLHFFVFLVGEHFEAVDDGPDRTDHVVTNARTDERREIEGF